MTNTLKPMIAGLAFFAMAGTASADPTFKATMYFDRTAPVEVTYQRFETQAYIACLNHYVDTYLGKPRHVLNNHERNNLPKFMGKCQRQILSRAIKGTRINALIALYDQLKNPAVSESQFAKNDSNPATAKR